MSSSGQAPNVSMDELLSSIKSMIEGESSGGGNPPEQGMVAEPPVTGALPGNAVDDGIMDLTQVAQTQPQVQPVAQGQLVAQGQPQGGQPIAQAPAVEAPVFPNPDAAMQQPAVQPPVVQPPVAGGEGMVGQTAQDAASQINDILGGMNADLGVEALAPAPIAAPDAGGMPFDEAPIDPRATVAPYPGDLMGDPMAGENPLREQPAAGQNLAAYQPMVNEVLGGNEGLGQAELSGLPAEMPDSAALQQHIVPQSALDPQLAVDPMVNPAAEMQPDGALSRGLAGSPPMGNPALQGQMGQPPIGQAPQGYMPQGQMPQGQVPQGQFGQAPLGQGQMQGQPPQGQMMAPQGQAPVGQVPQGQAPVGQMGMAGQPPGFDPRQESEFAMGQALSQADASLNASPLGQNPQGLPDHRGLPQPMTGGMAGGAPMQGMHPGGQQQQHQLPVLATGGGLPVPMGGAQLPVAQPMMGMADPSADQLPVEMRNNLEEIVKQLLKPLLREWLERNLPELLKTAVDDQGKIDPDKL